MKKFVFLILISLPLLTLGQQLENFSLVNVADNKNVSLTDYPSCEGIVIVFTSNNCPYDEYYLNRVSRLATKYNTRVPVLLVNSSTEPSESVEKMAERANKGNVTLPYLADKDQSLMTQLGAKKTPEAILLKNGGGKFSVVYRGAIDDNAQVEADVRQNYLSDAIENMLDKKPVTTPEVRPVGCTLRKKG